MKPSAVPENLQLQTWSGQLQPPGCLVDDRLILDIGGEGRHRGAWNLNPGARRTLQPSRGEPIRRRIRGRGETIPLLDASVDVAIVERTPLRAGTLEEIGRVMRPGGWVILRHGLTPRTHPHLLAQRLLPGAAQTAIVRLGRQFVLQTTIRLACAPARRVPGNHGGSRSTTTMNE